MHHTKLLLIILILENWFFDYGQLAKTVFLSFWETSQIFESDFNFFKYPNKFDEILYMFQ